MIDYERASAKRVRIMREFFEDAASLCIVEILATVRIVECSVLSHRQHHIGPCAV